MAITRVEEHESAACFGGWVVVGDAFWSKGFVSMAIWVIERRQGLCDCCGVQKRTADFLPKVLGRSWWGIDFSVEMGVWGSSWTRGGEGWEREHGSQAPARGEMTFWRW